ncbi:MAG: hypothetical protein US42_C0006G0041 [Candidatus Magasanikbacteria bacterium GW2011_GWC2_37_14]|uniref:Uncharacterized protein n=1 Tax=Candidatus Magasanikbacteria bacterium GW2011_GWC2_37_14 TaxID=1619046 RepID=A0A0G0IUA5_9BACT|nr:MAG: hypothetical protein US42_C0006G0041 [Candidatus Magasanikbacteria bacterium GW2011_GWC2_37_14]
MNDVQNGNSDNSKDLFYSSVLGHDLERKSEEELKAERLATVEEFFNTKIRSLLEKLVETSKQMENNKEQGATYEVKKVADDEYHRLKLEIQRLRSVGYQEDLGIPENKEISSLLRNLEKKWFSETGNEDEW